jgi:hypothetical protein
MECRDVLDFAVARIAGELPADRETSLERHIADCAGCREEVAAVEDAWSRLGEDADLTVSPDFRRRTLAMLENRTSARKVVAFRPRRMRAILQAAAMLVAAAGGYLLARASGRTPATPRGPASGKTAAAASLPDLSRRPKLSNVAYRADEPGGKVGVSFDVSTRYSVEARPDDPQMSSLLAYLMSSASGSEGSRGRAIDLVSQHYGEGAAPSKEIVSVLTETLKRDGNPGVRKKAAETLGQLAPTPAIRDAFIQALRSESNPAIRMLAVDGLAKAAQTLKDPTTIETLREKATDQNENGYVRVKAASALRKVEL